MEPYETQPGLVCRREQATRSTARTGSHIATALQRTPLDTE
jgi:hypothetical protein